MLGKLVLVVLAIVVIVVLLSGQGHMGGSCNSVQDVVGHSTECAYRLIKGNGLIVNGDEGIFALIGAIALTAALGLYHSRSKHTMTLSDRYTQFGVLPSSDASHYFQA